MKEKKYYVNTDDKAEVVKLLKYLRDCAKGEGSEYHIPKDIKKMEEKYRPDLKKGQKGR
jgi:hypothetical protein